MYRLTLMLVIVAAAVAFPFPQEAGEAAPALVPTDGQSAPAVEGADVDARHHYGGYRPSYGGYSSYGGYPSYGGYSSYGGYPSYGYNNGGYNNYYNNGYLGWREGQKSSDGAVASEPAAAPAQ